MLVVAANTDLGPRAGERVAHASRVSTPVRRTERVCAIADSFAGFAESNGGASSASLCQRTKRSLGVAELRPPCYPKSYSHALIAVVIEKLPHDERDTEKAKKLKEVLTRFLCFCYKRGPTLQINSTLHPS
jgi:hypothetical protein